MSTKYRPQRVESTQDPIYQVPAKPPVAIPEGCVRLVRLPYSQIYQIWYPGDVEPYETMVHNRKFNQQLVERGFDERRVEWIVDYVQNFRQIIVRLKPDAPLRPAPTPY